MAKTNTAMTTLLMRSPMAVTTTTSRKEKEKDTKIKTTVTNLLTPVKIARTCFSFSFRRQNTWLYLPKLATRPARQVVRRTPATLLCQRSPIYCLIVHSRDSIVASAPSLSTSNRHMSTEGSRSRASGSMKPASFISFAVSLGTILRYWSLSSAPPFHPAVTLSIKETASESCASEEEPRYCLESWESAPSRGASRYAGS